MTTETAPAFRSQLLDYYIALGIAVDQIGRTLLEDSSLSVRLENGLLEVWRGETKLRTYGSRDVELTSSDWQYAAARLAGA